MTDAALSLNAQGRLATLNEAGILDGSDCLVAARVCAAVGEEPTSDAALAFAFAVRAVRDGSTALDLADVAGWTAAVDVDEIEQDAETAQGLVDLPSPEDWLHTLQASPLVQQRILRIDLGLVYLDRYLSDELLIASALTDRVPEHLPPVDLSVVEESIGKGDLNKEQQTAVRSVATRPVTVLTGGPGMGKTHAIGQILTALLAASDGQLRIGLAAPTGKAAARMNQSLGATLEGDSAIKPAVTLHRLLGPLPGTNLRFRHGAHDPLPHDVVVVDEASMVSLNLMARLVESLSPTTRLLLVGDPDQLASVEAGSVLADVVAGLDASGAVVRLVQDYRMGDDRARLAAAFRTGVPDQVAEAIDQAKSGVQLIETDAPSLELIPRVAQHALKLRELAAAGDADAAVEQLGRLRLLCAHRHGPFGASHWNRLVEMELAKHAPDIRSHQMYVGRPILITRNDHGLGLNNGDAGVIVQTPDGTRAVIETGHGRESFPPWLLSEVETMHAMTVHKAQGSQAAEIIVLVPPVESRLLTREMLYTAVTRPQEHLTMVGTREAIALAVDTPVRRTSGLRQRLSS